MKVVIVGAGLGGLACAIACRREGIDVEILERSPEIHEFGAGIQVPPNGSRIMREFELLSQLLEKGIQVQDVHFRRYKDGRLLRTMPCGDDITQEYGTPWVYVFIDPTQAYEDPKACLVLFTGSSTIAYYMTKQCVLVRSSDWEQRSPISLLMKQQPILLMGR